MKNMEEVFNKVKQFVKKSSSQDRDIVHDWPHVRRVLKLMEDIGKEEEANMEVCKLAALFHDFYRPVHSMVNYDYQKKSIEKAEGVLKKFGYSEEIIKKVKKAIKKGNSPEGNVLHDADALDLFGAVGIARIFTYGGEMPRSILDSYDYFLKRYTSIKEKGMRTKKGRELFKPQKEFLEKFIKRFEKEKAR